MAAALWALPSSAQVLELSRPLPPPTTVPEAPPAATLERRAPLSLPSRVPDRPVFEELLFSLADPDRLLSGGMAAPTLSLAIRSQAWAFMPSGKFEQRDAINTLSEPTRNLTMAELPGGKRFVSLIDLGPDAEKIRLGDLGPKLSGTNGPLQRGVNSVIDYLHVPKPVALVAAGVAAVGAVYQFGTAPAVGLGAPVVLSGGMFKGRVNGSFQLNSEPHFKNARADMSARFKLPTLQLSALRIEQLELGGAVARPPDQAMILDTRWANLRGRLSWLEWCLGVHSDRADPNLWMVLETSVQRERFSVRGVLNQQMNTGHSRMMATATLRTGPVLSGLFIGSNDLVKHTFGVVGMAAF